MSDEMKNCCPPETTAPKMEVHDASEGSKDIKPKVISTAHKRLSQDEFQRKVAMVAHMYGVEKEAWGVAPAIAAARAGLGRAGTWAASKLPAWATGGTAKGIAGGTAAAVPLGIGAGALQGALTHKPSTLDQIMNALKGGYNTLAQNAGGHVGAGGIIGAGLGGLVGAMMPGEEEYEDDFGRIRKRKGSMLAGALRGAGLGGLAGGGLGAGLQAYNSGAFKFGSAIANLEKQAAPPVDVSVGMEMLPHVNAGKNPAQVPGGIMGVATQLFKDNPLTPTNELNAMLDGKAPHQMATPAMSRNPAAFKNTRWQAGNAAGKPAGTAATMMEPPTSNALQRFGGTMASRVADAARYAAKPVTDTAKTLNKARLTAGNALGEKVLYPAAKGVYNAGKAVSSMSGKAVSSMFGR